MKVASKRAKTGGCNHAAAPATLSTARTTLQACATQARATSHLSWLIPLNPT